MKSNIRNQMVMIIAAFATLTVGAIAQAADVDAAEIYCTIRDTGNHLNCQWVGKDQRRSMTPEETAQFIDKSEVAAYISVRSRKGMERVFSVDPESVPFRKLNEVKKTGSISEIAKAKLELFSEIEKRVVKISDDLDAAAVTMELVKYDDSVAVDKYKRELRRMDNEMIALKNGQGAGNASYEMGPKSVDQDATAGGEGLAEYYGSKYSFELGTGYYADVVTFGSTGTNPSYPIGTLDFRAAWGFQGWLANTYTEIETRNSLRTAATTAAGGASMNPAISNYTLKDGKCWGPWCAQIDIAMYTYVALAAKNNTQFDAYQDTFYGASAVYLEKIHNGLITYRAGYLLGSATNTMGISAAAGKAPSSEYLFVANIRYERNINRTNGAGGEIGYEQSTATLTGGNVTNQNLLATAFYKWMF